MAYEGYEEENRDEVDDFVSLDREVTLSYLNDEGEEVSYTVEIVNDRAAKLGRLLALMDELVD